MADGRLVGIVGLVHLDGFVFVFEPASAEFAVGVSMLFSHEYIIPLVVSAGNTPANRQTGRPQAGRPAGRPADWSARHGPCGVLLSAGSGDDVVALKPALGVADRRFFVEIRVIHLGDLVVVAEALSAELAVRFGESVVVVHEFIIHLVVSAGKPLIPCLTTSIVDITFYWPSKCALSRSNSKSYLDHTLKPQK